MGSISPIFFFYTLPTLNEATYPKPLTTLFLTWDVPSLPVFPNRELLPESDPEFPGERSLHSPAWRLDFEGGLGGGG